MAEPFDTDPSSSFGANAARARDDLNHRFQDLRRDAAAGARSAADTIDDRGATGSAAKGPAMEAATPLASSAACDA